MTCYPNSLDAQAVHSAALQMKEADGHRIKLIFFGYSFPRIHSPQNSINCAEITSLQTSNECADNSSPFLMTITVSLIVFLVVIIKHKHLYRKGRFHCGLD